LARENAEATGLVERVTFLASDWFSALPPDRRFQLIVANPPYLSDAETGAAQAEVKDFEPVTALSAGPNSAAALELIIPQARAWLEPGGLLACETGITQHPQLLSLAAGAGYVRTGSYQDLTGRDRYVLAFV
jgi:release factor glutamine methyltransferase